MKITFALVLTINCVFAWAQIKPESIEIMRDQWGVPHIYAPTDAEVAYGLAWAHAEDDFKTMQLTLLAGKQMLGRYLGKDGAAADYLARLIRAKDLVAKQYMEMSADYTKVIEGYTAGLNSYAAVFPEQVLVKKSFPVTSQEVLQGYMLSLAVFSGVDKTVKKLLSDKPAADDLPTGSNAIAISKNRTIEQETFLAINSHQPLEGPMAWYEAHLISDEGWNILGGLFPGGATVFLGINENLGWAHTVNHPDNMDVYRLDPTGKKDQYLVDGSPFKLEKEKIKLAVKTSLGINVSIKKAAYTSVFGPVVKSKTGWYAFSTGALYDIKAPQQWYEMNKAQNFTEFRQALELVAIPGFSVVYADRYDTIYFLDNGKIPLRNPAYNWESIVPGNTMETRHTSFHTLNDLPQSLINGGYAYSTNHTPYTCCLPGDNPKIDQIDPTMGFKLWENNRSTRLRYLLDEKEKINYDDFLRIKYDSQLPDTLLYDMNLNVLYQMSLEELPTKEAGVLKLIQEWDKTGELESVGAVQYLLVYKYFIDKYKKGVFDETVIISSPEAIEGLTFASDYLMQYFGKTNIKLGEFQFLVRGENALPMRGLPDVLAAMYSVPWKEGKVKGVAGESYILLGRFRKEGLPILESVNTYGASNVPESPHYADQMSLFVNQQRKPMTLDIEQVRREAKRIYNPQ